MKSLLIAVTLLVSTQAFSKTNGLRWEKSVRGGITPILWHIDYVNHPTLQHDNFNGKRKVKLGISNRVSTPNKVANRSPQDDHENLD